MSNFEILTANTADPINQVFKALIYGATYQFSRGMVSGFDRETGSQRGVCLKLALDDLNDPDGRIIPFTYSRPSFHSILVSGGIRGHLLPGLEPTDILQYQINRTHPVILMNMLFPRQLLAGLPKMEVLHPKDLPKEKIVFPISALVNATDLLIRLGGVLLREPDTVMKRRDYLQYITKST